RLADQCAGASAGSGRAASIQQTAQGYRRRKIAAAENRQTREVTSHFIVVKEEKGLVLFDWTTDVAAKGVTRVLRFNAGNSREAASRIETSQKGEGVAR